MDDQLDIIKILIPAVGGQGGGVLTEWLIQAFQLEGYMCQAIGLPGLSQRGGSTTYYLEVHPTKVSSNATVMFSQYPVPGDVDVILAQEFLELGRVLEEGYGSEKTTIVASTHRIFSALEKMPISSGIYSDAKLEKIANEFSKEFIGFNALKLAKSNGLDEMGINAILLGALAASGVLPVGEVSHHKAIEGLGIAVESNLTAFRIGWDIVTNKKKIEGAKSQPNDWQTFVSLREQKLGPKRAEKFKSLLTKTLADYPIHLKEILAEALYRLIDYQSPRYAKKYLRDLNKIYEIDKQYSNGFQHTEQFAKNLALLYTYEDGIRVADLKTKPERFQKIRDEVRLQDDQLYRVVDYLKPDFYEIYGLFPSIIVTPLVRLFNSKPISLLTKRKHPITFSQKPVTSSFTGFFRLWILTKFKFTRPWSYRYRQEHKIIKKYKEAVEKFSGMTYELGVLIARSGSLIKGYGNVRRRTMGEFVALLEEIITPLAEHDQQNDATFKTTLEIGQKTMALLSSETPDVIEQARELTKNALKSKAA